MNTLESELSNHRAQTGQRAEALAKAHLQAHGLRTLTQNYRCRCGEIDLIMQDQAQLVFVEVRFRQSMSHGGAIHSLDHHKQQRLRRAAEHYLKHHHSHCLPPCRFDLVAIGPRCDAQHLQWLTSVM